MSKIRWLGPLCICVRREIDQVITAAKSGIGTFETCPPILSMSVHRGRPEVAVVRPNRRE